MHESYPTESADDPKMAARKYVPFTARQIQCLADAIISYLDWQKRAGIAKDLRRKRAMQTRRENKARRANDAVVSGAMVELPKVKRSWRILFDHRDSGTKNVSAQVHDTSDHD